MRIILRCEQQTPWTSFSLQRLPLTRAFKGFFFREFSWTSINCFHGFTRALTEKVPSSLNEGRIISNDDGFLNYFIKMKDYIVKTTRSLRAEWNSRNILYSLRNGFQVVYLFDVWKHGSRGRLNCNRTQIIITIVVSFGKLVYFYSQWWEWKVIIQPHWKKVLTFLLRKFFKRVQCSEWV